jgi:hypothetical protein
MGNSNSQLVYVYSKDDIYDNIGHDTSVINHTKTMPSKTQIPLQVTVAHFTPSSFPMIPVVSKTSSALCADSWSRIVSNDFKKDGSISISGMTAFYNEVTKYISI